MSITMKSQMIISFLFALVFPAFLTAADKTLIKSKSAKVILLALYIIIILMLTLFRREPGERSVHLQLFWSYCRIRDAEYRWEILMNIFLFIPFGFLLSYVLNFKLLHVFLTGLLLSALIESLQYAYGLGLCELDDVFNNTVGSLIGYGYRKFLVKQAARIKTNIQGSGGTR